MPLPTLHIVHIVHIAYPQPPPRARFIDIGMSRSLSFGSFLFTLVFLFASHSLLSFSQRRAKQSARWTSERARREFTFLIEKKKDEDEGEREGKNDELMHGYWRDKSQNLIQVPSSPVWVARHAVVPFSSFLASDIAATMPEARNPGGQSLDRIKSKSGFIAIEPVERDGREDRRVSAWVDGSGWIGGEWIGGDRRERRERWFKLRARRVLGMGEEVRRILRVLRFSFYQFRSRAIPCQFLSLYICTLIRESLVFLTIRT